MGLYCEEYVAIRFCMLKLLFLSLHFFLIHFRTSLDYVDFGLCYNSTVCLYDFDDGTVVLYDLFRP